MSVKEKLKMFVDQTYAPASKFTEDDVPDLTGKIMVVTGANTGIGKEIARVLLVRNAKVYIACRSKDKAEAAIADLKQMTAKSDIQFIELDLSSFESVKGAAEVLKSKEKKLDVLFNNAGVMSPPIEQLTTEGYDMQFGVNAVGTALFTSLLLPLLRAATSTSSTTASSSPSTGSTHASRVVFTSSLGHMAASASEPIAWDTLKPVPGSKGEEKRKKIGPDGLYYQSKVGVIVIAREFAKHYGTEGIVFTSLHPGTIESELGRHWGSMRKRMMGLVIPLRSTPMGAINSLYAGTAPEASSLNGKYIIPWARVGEPRQDITDDRLGEKLWEWLKEQNVLPEV